MPQSLPAGRRITIARRSLPWDYRMPTMELSTDHYSVGFLISGDRRIITPTHCYDYHAGDVSLAAPYIYHRTIPQSRDAYESYLVKFSKNVAESFSECVGADIFNGLIDGKISRFAAGDIPLIKQFFDDMYEEEQKPAPYKDEILKGMLFRLLCEVWERRLHAEQNAFKQPLSEPVLKAICEIEEHYSEDIHMEVLAKELGFSAAYFSRLFKAQLNKSFSAYLADVRIRHVKEMLLNTELRVSEIALACGYCNGDYLSAAFHKRSGMKPTEFRRQKTAG